MDFFSKNNKNKVLLSLLIVVIIILTVLLGEINKKQLEYYAASSVELEAKNKAEYMDSCYDAALNSIQITSYLSMEKLGGRDIKYMNIDAILANMVESTPFDSIEFIDENGINKTMAGEEFDSSNRPYYQRGILGETGVWINYAPKYSDEYLLDFYTPFYNDGEIKGVLVGYFGAESAVEPLITSYFLDKTMITFLCDENNRIISTNHDVGDSKTLRDACEYIGLFADSCDLIEQRTTESNRSAFPIDGMKGPTYSCVAQCKNAGWKVVQIIPRTSFEAVFARNTYGTYALAAIIAALSLLFLFYLRHDSQKKHNRILAEKDRVVQNYEQILTMTAYSTYVGVRRIDLESGNSEYIYFDNFKIRQMPVGDWDEWLGRQNEVVNKEDYNEVKEFYSLANMRLFEEGEKYRMDYRSSSKDANGYYKTYTSIVGVCKINGRRTAILSTIDNTAALVKELEQKRWLEAAASIYVALYNFDLKSDKIEAVHSAPHVDDIIDGRTDGIRKILTLVMKKLTSEKYLEEMMEFIDLTTLDSRMEGVNTISMEFLGTVSGWCRARFIKVDCDEDGLIRRVIWAVENIDYEKRKTNKLLYLSETDLMTGIRNRGSGEKKISDLLASCHAGMFCLLDVDKFKAINDVYGHGIGDKVLIAIAKSLKDCFRETDVVMRLGGDEFAVFADGVTDRNQAVMLLERFFKSIEEISVPELGEYKPSVSVGVFIKENNDSMDFGTIYRTADACTYESKKVIGNAYTFYEY